MGCVKKSETSCGYGSGYRFGFVSGLAEGFEPLILPAEAGFKISIKDVKVKKSGISCESGS